MAYSSYEGRELAKPGHFYGAPNQQASIIKLASKWARRMDFKWYVMDEVTARKN